MENNLPEGWVEVQLENLLTSLESGSRPKGGVRGIISGIPSIGGEHLNDNGGFKFSNIKFVPKEFASKMNRGQIKTGDVLIVKDGATTGKTSFVSPTFPYPIAFVNEHVFICRSSSELNSKYIYYFLWSSEGQKRILENFKGSAQGGINTGFESNTLIPVAPYKEQKRIVHDLDAFFVKIENNNKRLEKIPQILKRFRQSVLADALNGKLTEDWRKKNNIEGDWEQLTLGDVIEEIQAGRSIKCEERPPKKSEIGIVKVSAVSWGEFLQDESKTITDSKYFNEKFIINCGDFLISRANTKELVGAVVIVKEISKALMLSDKILRIKFNHKVHPRWILYFLRSKDGRSQIEESATGNQQSMMNISQSKIRDIVFKNPIPVEQLEIIQRVETLFAFADKIESRYLKAKAQLNKLPQSILSKAFRGELVPQDPNDEPANVLLERIKAEKGILKAATRGKKTKSTISNE